MMKDLKKNEENKKVFLSLALFILVTLILLDIVILKFTSSFFIIGLIFIVAIALLAFVVFFLIMGVYFDLKFPLARASRKIYVKFLFPMIIMAGKLFNVSKEKIEQSLIEINNKFIRLKNLKVDPEDILLLLPHCLQKSSCNIKLVWNLANCVGCGKCNFADLTKLGAHQKIKLALAKGGTEARKAIEEIKPKAVVAVACERDLISGIIDSYPLSVFGIVNERPFGYCRDTCINTLAIKEGIDLFMGKAA